MNVAIDAIRTDGGTQSRAAIDFTIVEEYAQAMGEGAQFPPIVLFFDGSEYWLADGFHRHHAHKVLGLAEVEADVRQGTVRDAILFSVGVNSSHGLRRTNADKRRSVMRLLDDAEWSTWSDREIARRCGVSQPFVGNLRPSDPKHTDNDCQYQPRTFIHPKTGQPSQMNTARIGTITPASAPRPTPMSEVERIESLGASRGRAEQIARDNSNGFISSAIWEIERQMKVLPDDPREAARRFPFGHRHTLNPVQLLAYADWLADFVQEIERTTHVAAE